MAKRLSSQTSISPLIMPHLRISKESLKLIMAFFLIAGAWNIFYNSGYSTAGGCSKSLSADSVGGTCGEFGTCLVDRCVCDPSYEGKNCEFMVDNASAGCNAPRDAFYPDRCMNIGKQPWGRLMVSSQLSTATKVPTRNADQTAAFDGWNSLPEDLGHVVEFGAGPYTKLRLILEDGQTRRSVKSATMIDPLVSEYIRNPKIQTTYQNGNICVDKTAGWGGGCIQTYLASFGGEDPLPKEQYDTAIMVNTIEHCKDAVKVFDNIFRSLKPGGVFIFGEEFASENQLERNNQCHPIRITQEFYKFYLNTFYGTFLMPIRLGRDIPGVMKIEGAKNSIYAIVRKSYFSFRRVINTSFFRPT
eukprot:scaffold1144_cov22-Cyclotella_meneghiniana.AAC.1